jgi:hypothetical protein
MEANPKIRLSEGGASDINQSNDSGPRGKCAHETIALVLVDMLRLHFSKMDSS